MDEVENLAQSDIPIILVGNKLDLDDKRQVPYELAKTFAEEKKIQFLECSAFSAENVDEIFIELSNLMLQKNAPRVYQTPQQTPPITATFQRNGSCC